MTSIDQSVTTVLDDLATPADARQRGHLDAVLRSVSQLRSLIDHQLEASQAESTKRYGTGAEMDRARKWGCGGKDGE